MNGRLLRPAVMLIGAVTAVSTSNERLIRPCRIDDESTPFRRTCLSVRTGYIVHSRDGHPATLTRAASRSPLSWYGTAVSYRRHFRPAANRPPAERDGTLRHGYSPAMTQTATFHEFPLYVDHGDMFVEMAERGGDARSRMRLISARASRQSTLAVTFHVPTSPGWRTKMSRRLRRTLWLSTTLSLYQRDALNACGRAGWLSSGSPQWFHITGITSSAFRASLRSSQPRRSRRWARMLPPPRDLGRLPRKPEGRGAFASPRQRIRPRKRNRYHRTDQDDGCAVLQPVPDGPVVPS